MHSTYGWLLLRACIAAGKDVRSAWSEMLHAMSKAGNHAELPALTLDAPEGHNVAELFKEVSHRDTSGMIQDINVRVRCASRARCGCALADPPRSDRGRGGRV